MARPAGDRGVAAGAGDGPPRHGDGRAHPRAARRADHVRVQGGVLGRRGPPPSRAAARGPSRWLVGQLGGAVGVAGLLRPGRARAPAAFCAELGLADPGISWLTSRDRVAEFGALLAMVCGTLARIGNEVYELQRPEIGELREPTSRGRGRQHHDAAQAQSRGQRAPRHPVPAGAGQRRGAARGHGRRARAGRARLEGRVGRAARGLPADRRRAAARPAPARGAGGRRRRDAGQPRPSRRPTRVRAGPRRAEPRLGKHAPSSCSTTSSRRVAGRRTPVEEAVVRAGVGRPRRGQRVGGPAGRWAPPARWSTPSWPGRAPPGEAEPGSWRCAGRGSSWPPCRPRCCGPGAWSAALGAGPLFVKRDDLTGFAVAGNKARPLEYLLGDATGQGADVLVTGGGAGSNFCAAAAVAAARPGLDCDLLFPAAPAPRPAPVNLALGPGRRGAAAVRCSGQPRPGRRGGRRAGGDACGARAAARTPCRGAARHRSAPLGYALAAERAGAPVRRRRRRPSGWSSSPPGPAAPWRAWSPARWARPAVADGRRVGEPAASGPLRRRCSRWPAGAPTCSGSAPPDPCHVDVRDLLGPGFGVAVRRGPGQRPTSRCDARGCCSTTTTAPRR